MPPAISTDDNPTLRARGEMVALICMANSRVGESTTASGRPRFALRLSRRVSNAKAKASVLPEPVRPRPRTSRPAIASGNVAIWMGNGSAKPEWERALASGLHTPRSRKVVMITNQML